MTYLTVLLISEFYSPIIKTLVWEPEHLSFVLVTTLGDWVGHIFL